MKLEFDFWQNKSLYAQNKLNIVCTCLQMSNSSSIIVGIVKTYNTPYPTILWYFVSIPTAKISLKTGLLANMANQSVETVENNVLIDNLRQKK